MTLLTDELVNFLKNSFQVQLDEISAAVDLLIESIDAAAETVTSKGNELLADKEYEDAIDLINKAWELDALSQKVKKYADTFQIEDVALVSEDEALDDIEKNLPNYSDFEVDNTVIHTLHENFVHKRPYAFELRGKKVFVTEWKRMLVETCNILTDIDRKLIEKFPDNPKFNGKKSKYFTTGDPALMRSPQKLDKIKMFVETNFSANFIRNLIIKMINHYKIPLSDYKIYLRADYTKLHQVAGDNDSVGKEISRVADNNIERQRGTGVIEITGDCIKRISDHLQKPLVGISKAIYRTSDHKTTVVCLTSSKRDKVSYLDYWFGLRVNQKNTLANTESAFLALGCGSKNKIILIPYGELSEWIGNMSTTGEEGNVKHWHIVVEERMGSYSLRLRAGVQDVDLTSYIL